MGRVKRDKSGEVQESDFQKTTETRTKYYPSLHPIEVHICTLLWGGGVVLTICSLIPICANNEKWMVKEDLLTEGWSWLGRYIDDSDSEWSLWKMYAWSGYVIGFAGHFVIARITDSLLPSKRFEILLGYSIAFTTYFLHIEGMVFILFHVGVQYLAARISKSVTICWVTGLALLVWLHQSYEDIKRFYPRDPDKTYVLLICVGMSNLRYIGFSLEYVWQQKKRSSQSAEGKGKQRKSASFEIEQEFDVSFLALMKYQMYLPLLYGGPVMNYNEFALQARNPPREWTVRAGLKFFGILLKFVAAHFFIDFVLHYVHASALIYDNWSSSKRLKIYHLCGFSMAQVGFFYMKYLVLYGMPSHFATSDGLCPPGQPQCVYSKHRMTDFWKLVDKGLHKWLVRYIYIPCGGSKNGVFRAILSLTLSFCFVVVWHRPTQTHIRWGALSWLGVLLEYVAMELYQSAAVKNVESKYFTPQWSRRFRAFLSCFAFGFLIVSNLYFLSGIKMGDIYVKRFYTENIFATALIHVSLYGGAQSSMNRE